MNERKNIIPELLAPAGTQEALRAAIGAGADAVYLGVEDFNARKNAENFRVETLKETCDYVHMCGRRVYLTMNTVILPGEMKRALEVACKAWEAGVDAFIVQDFGLLREIKKAIPNVAIHASTQMNIHDKAGVEMAKRLGMERVTLSRELSFEEMKELSSLGIELEVFTHGALCVCYSGRCLLSSLKGKRSANRGLCAQPCRLPYDLVDEAGKKIDLGGNYPLSTKDLCSLPVLRELCETSVASLKIEGRMKSPEYVAIVVDTYRRALDFIATNPASYEASKEDMDDLTEAFSRGFTQAYLKHNRYADMMSIKRPNNWGVPVGRVKSVRGNRATIALSASIQEGDTLEFLTSRGSFAEVARNLEQSRKPVAFAPEKSEVTLEVTSALSPSDRVMRVRSAKLAQRAEELSAPKEGLPIELACKVQAKLGLPFMVTLKTTDGAFCASAQGAVVEAARTRAVTENDIKEHIARLGGTPYSIVSWDVDIDEGIGLGFSTVHAIRREALERLQKQLLERYSNREVAANFIEEETTKEGSKKIPVREDISIAVLVRSKDAARAAFAAGANIVHMDLFDWEYEDKPSEVTPVIPNILHNDERERAALLIDETKTYVAGSLGAIDELGHRGIAVEADDSIPVLNASAVEEIGEHGASRIWLSAEASLYMLSGLASVGVPLGLTVFGKQEMMVTEHCIFSSQGECSHKCRTCPRNSKPRFLKDRKGFLFPLYTDEFGRSHIFNPVTLDLIPSITAIYSAGVSSLRIDARLLSAEETAWAVAQLVGAIEDLQFGILPEKKVGATTTTTGNFFRGIL